METNYLNGFLKEHPIYEKITFSNNLYPAETHLHPILPASQAIIDNCIETGHKRIAVVLPDDDTNILPLIVAKYLSNVQEDPDYAHGVFEDIQPGQRLKLGKSVVEFVEIDKNNNTIKFKTGKIKKVKWGNGYIDRDERTTYTTPIKNYYLYFERSSGAVSKDEKFNEERRKIQTKLHEDGMVDIDLLATKRTVLNKTIAVLSSKKEFKDFLDNFFVSIRKFADVITYGEFADNNVRLYNTGKLDCLPAMIVSAKIGEIAEGIYTDNIKGKAESIIVTQSKYNEVINNTGELKKCLKSGVPFIMFVPESEFETFPMLTELGFDFWHWDPEMIRNGGLSSDNLILSKDSLFGNLSKKVFNAATSSVVLRTCKYQELKKINNIIRTLVKKSIETNSPLKQMILSLNRLVKSMIDISSPINGALQENIDKKYLDIFQLWNDQKQHYSGTKTANEIDAVFEMLLQTVTKAEPWKSIELKSVLSSNTFRDAVIVVPNRYQHKIELQEYTKTCSNSECIRVMSANDFHQISNEINIDCLIVTFFDQAEYIKIRKSYCYKKLIYLLYDFENAWRQGYINKYESCFPREKCWERAKVIGFSNQLSYEFTSFEPLEDIEIEKEYEEISDYNFELKMIRSIIGKSNASASSSDSVECIPVVFNQDTIGYFNPSHNLIDITPLCRGDIDRPVKKEASKLIKGDIILIRQRGRDIILDKADELMAIKGVSSLREASELWVKALRKYSEGKTIDKIKEQMNIHGADCDALQIRYWLAGVTIRPDKDSVIQSISELCPEVLPQDKVQEVLAAGNKVQEYHREAGRWLTKELKNCANDILQIYLSGNNSGNIDGIGDICIYSVEEVIEKEYINRGKLNKLEVII